MKQTILNGSVSIIGSLATYVFGGWSDLLTLFFFVLVLDYVSGISASLIEGKGLSSAVGYKGLIKKFAVVSIIVLASLMDKALQSNVIMSGAIYFFLANELISIVENYGRMGLPLPNQIKNVISVLKNKEANQ